MLIVNTIGMVPMTKDAVLFEELGAWLHCQVPITDEDATSIFPDIIVIEEDTR